MIDILVPDWPAPKNVGALSTLRRGGVSQGRYTSANFGAHVGDDAARVEENRRRLGAQCSLPAEPVWLTQVHGAVATDLDVSGGPNQADAAMTRRPGMVCAVLTADCLPILLCERDGAAVAAVHAGWRGLAAGVVDAAIAALAVPGADLLAWLGPGIGPAAFEVGEDVRDAFCSVDSVADLAFKPSAQGKSKYLADLPLLARQRLLRLGVEHIYGANDCTYSDPARFFSYRRDGETGRHATLIWLK